MRQLREWRLRRPNTSGFSPMMAAATPKLQMQRQSELDTTFQPENGYYVPSFFAAAIIGENLLRSD
jgi:hypothetical protein